MKYKALLALLAVAPISACGSYGAGTANMASKEVAQDFFMEHALSDDDRNASVSLNNYAMNQFNENTTQVRAGDFYSPSMLKILQDIEEMDDERHSVLTEDTMISVATGGYASPLAEMIIRDIALMEDGRGSSPMDDIGSFFGD